MKFEVAEAVLGSLQEFGITDNVVEYCLLWILMNGERLVQQIPENTMKEVLTELNVPVTRSSKTKYRVIKLLENGTAITRKVTSMYVGHNMLELHIIRSKDLDLGLDSNDKKELREGRFVYRTEHKGDIYEITVVKEFMNLWGAY